MLEKKKRLDQILVEMGLVQSRQRAQALIMAGRVLLDDHPICKPGIRISSAQHIVLREEDIPYVSRGGLKLEGALQALKIDVKGLVCLDVGASTGGFTDCLLQQGAHRVFAVDVGYGQLAWKLRQDSRVQVIERTNIRHMPAEALPCPIDLITIDVSFISLKIVVPAIMKFLKKEARILALIKPQFEVGKGMVGKGGVVRNSLLHDMVVKDLSSFFKKSGFLIESVIPSELRGTKGNREFFISLGYDE
ncbi:TlyA family rRNA (cytidine-2'-O)-methyltransferase [Desulfobacteraceae bacterium SEEP-SAG9]|nr:TlyA family rRNA (cytidine-2'-O)-methyltransferase [Desulfobacteraceae bacterium SEEP-SAG9]